MKPYRPLFLTGVARSGSNLLGRMLDAHPDLTVAVDPFLALFRRFRNDVLGLPPEASDPFRDGYFSDAAIAELDALLSSDLDRPFSPPDRGAFLETCRARTRIECPDLAPHVEELAAGTYRESFARGLGLIARVRGAARWVGFKEVWIVDFLPALARAFPMAQFILLHRDPRAVLASLSALGRRDPTQMAHPLSYLRHWRKTAAAGFRFAHDPLFAGRLRILRYEDLVRAPEPTARELCEFLETPFDPAMTDIGRYRDPATGERWAGNSSVQPVLTGFQADRTDHWRNALDIVSVRMVEYVCGPEMRLAGYPAASAGPPASLDGIRSLRAAQNVGRYSWRTDTGDPDWEFARERDRYMLLGEETTPGAAVRRAFLFEDVFLRLRRDA